MKTTTIYGCKVVAKEDGTALAYMNRTAAQRKADAIRGEHPEARVIDARSPARGHYVALGHPTFRKALREAISRAAACEVATRDLGGAASDASDALTALGDRLEWERAVQVARWERLRSAWGRVRPVSGGPVRKGVLRRARKVVSQEARPSRADLHQGAEHGGAVRFEVACG